MKILRSLADRGKGIILLDEPLTYLDIRHKLETAELIKTLREMGKTIVAVMHDLPLAFGFSDRIAVIKDAKIAAFDTPQKICDSGIVQEVFGIDLQYSPAEKSYHYKYPSR